MLQSLSARRVHARPSDLTIIASFWLLVTIWTSISVAEDPAPALPSQSADTPAESDGRQPVLLHAWGKKGAAAGEFHSPIGLALQGNEAVLVADLQNARIQYFSLTGTFLKEFALPQDGPARTAAMLGGIVVDDEQLVYVSWMTKHKVSVFRATGELVREWGKLGAGPDELNQPGGLWLTAEGELLVADQINHRVQRFSKTGEHRGSWGRPGEAAGEFGGTAAKGSRFGGPHYLAGDRRGNVYTTEGELGRVQCFTSQGEPLHTFGSKSIEPGAFGEYTLGMLPYSVGPIGIAVDQHDRVFVSSLNDRVQAYDRQGRFLFGIHGTGAEGDRLLHPHALAIDHEGCLLIADSGNHRVLRFRLPPP